MQFCALAKLQIMNVMDIQGDSGIAGTMSVKSTSGKGNKLGWVQLLST